MKICFKHSGPEKSRALFLLEGCDLGKEFAMVGEKESGQEKRLREWEEAAGAHEGGKKRWVVVERGSCWSGLGGR